MKIARGSAMVIPLNADIDSMICDTRRDGKYETSRSINEHVAIKARCILKSSTSYDKTKQNQNMSYNGVLTILIRRHNLKGTE